MVRSKPDTYIGFCIKAGKISLGAGAIDMLRGGVYLLIADKNCAKNSKRLALKFKNRFGCPLVLCNENFEVKVNKPGCKLAAIRDRELAKAILENLDQSYELYAGGSL